MTPSERAREIAEAIFTEWQASCSRYPEGYPSPMGPIVERHIAAALTIPPGHVRDEHGVDRDFYFTGVISAGTDLDHNKTGEWRYGMLWFSNEEIAREAAEATRGGGK